MAKMYLMCGCSGAGKTTFSKAFAKKNNVKYFGIDDYYALVNGDECIRDNSFEVWIEFYKAIHNAEVNNEDCIIDTNNLTVGHRTQFLEWFPTFEHHIIFIDADGDLRKKNNLSRKRHVPDDVMDRMAQQLEIPLPHRAEGFESVTFIKNDNNNFIENFVFKNFD